MALFFFFYCSFYPVTWGQSYLTSLGLLQGALVWPCSPGPWGTGRGPLGNSWFRRSQGRLRELCGEKTNWGALPGESMGAWLGSVWMCLCVCGRLAGWLGDGRAHTRTLTHTLTHLLTDILIVYTNKTQRNLRHTLSSPKTSVTIQSRSNVAKWAMQERGLKAEYAQRFLERLEVNPPYLKPSLLGANRLGFGGSLWQRGTFTGRGLFLGAEKKKNKTPAAYLLTPPT